MKSATISGGPFVTVLVLLVLGVNHRALEQDVDAKAATSPATTTSAASTQQADQGFLYGRVTTDDRGRGGCASEATRRRSGATTSTPSRPGTRGPPTRRSSG